MAKQQLRNDMEVGNLLYNAMNSAIEYVMKKLFEENEKLIEQYVYDKYPGEHYYERTKQFLDAWNYKIKKMGSTRPQVGGVASRTYATFHYDPRGMDYVPSKAQHGTPSASEMYWEPSPEVWQEVESAWGDAREYLADILYQGKTGPLFGEGPWRAKRDAWTPLINKLDRGRLFTWFEEGMRNQKLVVYKR